MTTITRHRYTSAQLSLLVDECGAPAVNEAIGRLSTYDAFAYATVDLLIDTLGGVYTIEAEYRLRPTDPEDHVVLATWEGEVFTFHSTEETLT